MIITLFFACILPGPDLVGDSDRPFGPPLNELDDGETEADSENGILAYADGDEIYVEHYDVQLPCDFDDSEVSIYTDTSEFQVEVVYSERDPEDCYFDLDYSLDFAGNPSGTYQLEAHGDETSFEY